MGCFQMGFNIGEVEKYYIRFNKNLIYLSLIKTFIKPYYIRFNKNFKNL